MIHPTKLKNLLSIIFILMSSLISQTASAKGDVEKAGDALLVLIPAVGLGSTFFYEEGNEGTIQFLESMVTAGAVSFGLKKAISKQRPNGECCDSFPSGHATGAFMGASFIQKRYGWKYGIPAYLGAAFVGYSRIESDKHYTEDVLAGAAIGVISSYIFTTPYKGFEVTPIASNGFYGLSVHKTW
ncbi:MAG TPA: phosphatase PAP2 family protein [Emcibacteraceae bacterium]|nr:phosphatase PAP2 family protein [Emcibacteraceae bacterium]